MQVFILLLMIALMAHDTLRYGGGVRWEGWVMLPATIAPFAVIFLLGWMRCRRTLRLLSRHPQSANRLVGRLDLNLRAMRTAIVLLFVLALYWFGWLTWLRTQLGDFILLDEAIALAPPLLAAIGLWWAYYPVDRRLREASLIRTLDQGKPVYPVWSRGQYVLSNIRHHLLLILVPLALIITWVETVNLIGRRYPVDDWALGALMLGGCAGVFVLAPVVIRTVWDTAPLPDGPLRERLLELCRTYRVRVRELLLWRTYGGLVNGAVMGLVGRLRYILLTDGLIEQLPGREIEAVMAHELGHIRRHHMPWLVVCAMATLVVIITAVTLVAEGMAWGADMAGIGADSGLWRLLWPAATETNPGGIGAAGAAGGAGGARVNLGDLFVIAVSTLGWITVFGYLSRRFERQADVFATQHMARRLASPDDPAATDDSLTISPEAVAHTAQALHRVAAMNHASPDRKSWRHGSINWRIAHLKTLVDRRIDDCPIDRHMARLRWGCAALLVLTVGLSSGARYFT